MINRNSVPACPHSFSGQHSLGDGGSDGGSMSLHTVQFRGGQRQPLAALILKWLGNN
jgi:hypothetical protein